jgi:hypothetical protein
MALRPPTTMSRERILEFGGAGLGKSYDFYCIALLSKITKSDAVFYVVDTDVSAWRMLSDPKFTGLFDADGNTPTVVVKEVYDWESLLVAMGEVQQAMRPQDWLMVDMISPTWDWVQGAFTDKIFNKDLDTYFLEARKAQRSSGDKGGSFEGWKDWPVINAMYGKFTQMLLRCKGNLYCTSEQKKINSDTTEKDTKLLFGPYGFVPVGQKRNPHLFQTILWKIASRPEVWEVTTIKDRSRSQLAGAPIKDFAKDYLVKVAGWKLA